MTFGDVHINLQCLTDRRVRDVYVVSNFVGSVCFFGVGRGAERVSRIEIPDCKAQTTDEIVQVITAFWSAHLSRYVS